MLERLVQYLDFKDITIYGLEKNIGVPKGSVYRAIRQNANISSNVMQKIAFMFPDLNLIWLFTGRGDMVIDDNLPPGVGDQVSDSRDLYKRIWEFIVNKDLSISEFSKKVKISTKDLLLGLTSEIYTTASHVVRISRAYPELNNIWLLTGEGNMISDDHPLEDHQEPILHADLELIDEIEGTEFRQLSDGHNLIITFLVTRSYREWYLKVWSKPEHIEELPKHSLVLNRRILGVYRSFEVAGDSMEDGTENSIYNGDIVTGRRFEKLHGRHMEFLSGSHVIVTKSGIILSRISDYDSTTKTILCIDLNPAHRENYEIEIKDIHEVYQIISVSRYFSGR